MREGFSRRIGVAWSGMEEKFVGWDTRHTAPRNVP